MEKYILAMDQGTTSSRALIFDQNSQIKAGSQKEFKQIFPKPGWVEHDAGEIWSSQITSAKQALDSAGLSSDNIEAIGITNQRETIILWERTSGKAVYNAIVWQCRRTTDICKQLKHQGLEPMIKEKTGLVIDPYFSATKIMWIFDNLPELKKRATRGELCFGTVDSWLIYNLSGEHLTDVSNASRTLLYNIHTGQWDNEILKALDIPASILPKVAASSGITAHTKKEIFGSSIPIAGSAGDQQAALFGQCCFKAGEAKNTYGTGCFTLMNTGNTPVISQNGLLTTIAWDIGEGLVYALEGAVFVAGAVIQWLRDNLALIKTASESEKAAKSIKDTGGVYFVPAFTGMGAPHWDPEVRGSLFGLTRGTSREQIIRSALESIAYQSFDLLKAMEKDAEKVMKTLKVDGGATANNFLMQFQADILGIRVQKPVIAETTALGAAYLAGLGTGVWNHPDDIKSHWKLEKEFSPLLAHQERSEKLKAWEQAVKAARIFKAP